MGEEPKNETKPEFKGNLGFVWLVGILVILLGCTVVYTLKITVENKELKQAQPIPQQVQSTIQTPVTTQEQSKIENTTTETTEETKKVVKKLDDSKELVYTFASEKSKKYDYSFDVPYVNINSDYAKEVNKKIQKEYSINKLVKDAKKAQAEVINFVEYNTYINNNTLSLVILGNDGLQTKYNTYNIDIYTGEKITNQQVLKSKNVSEKEFLSKVEDLCIKELKNIYGDSEVEQKCIDKTIKNNKNTNIKLFLDKNGKINIIPLLYNEAMQVYEVERIINTKL